jgi:hypothetical protein
MRRVSFMAPCGLPAAQQVAGRSPPFALAAGAFVQALAVKLKPRKIGPDVAPTLVEAR